MRRGENMFDIDPSVHDEVAEGIKIDGSNLCGISAHCSWEETNNRGFICNVKYNINILFKILTVIFENF